MQKLKQKEHTKDILKFEKQTNKITCIICDKIQQTRALQL